MSHLVIYDVDGADCYEQFVALDEAVALVERLSNDGNQSARLFRLEELKLEVKAYYRVQVGSSLPPAPSAEPSSEPEPIQDSLESESSELPEPMTVEAVIGDIDGHVTAVGPPPEPPTFIEAPTDTHGDEYVAPASVGGVRRGLFGR